VITGRLYLPRFIWWTYNEIEIIPVDVIEKLSQNSSNIKRGFKPG
jgi:hypothetical protein